MQRNIFPRQLWCASQSEQAAHQSGLPRPNKGRPPENGGRWGLSGKCLWAHFGVPCGTASRAQLRRLNKKVHGPPPLRSFRFPDRIPGVSGLHLVKLRAENRLYSFMRKLIKKMQQMNIVWTVENPLTSLLWETSYWLDIAEATGHYYCELHNCMFGGTRLKRTCLASNCSAIMALNIF